MLKLWIRLAVLPSFWRRFLAAQMNAAVTKYVGAVQDALSGEARSSLFSNIPNIVTGRISARDAVEQAMRLN